MSLLRYYFNSDILPRQRFDSSILLSSTDQSLVSSNQGRVTALSSNYARHAPRSTPCVKKKMLKTQKPFIYTLQHFALSWIKLETILGYPKDTEKRSTLRAWRNWLVHTLYTLTTVKQWLISWCCHINTVVRPCVRNRLFAYKNPWTWNWQKCTYAFIINVLFIRGTTLKPNTV